MLDLSQLDTSALSYLELPLRFERSKHPAAGGQARLVLSFKGWVNSFGTLLADTKHIPGGMQDYRRDAPAPWGLDSKFLHLLSACDV